MKAVPYPNPSVDSLMRQCRALHAQSGRLLLQVSLVDAGQRDLGVSQNELAQLKSYLENLEALLAQKEDLPAAQQLSLLP